MVTKSERVTHRKNISRNALCPCGSGKKFKHCCIHRTVKNETDFVKTISLNQMLVAHEWFAEAAKQTQFVLTDGRVVEIKPIPPGSKSTGEFGPANKTFKAAGLTPETDIIQLGKELLQVVASDIERFIAAHPDREDVVYWRLWAPKFVIQRIAQNDVIHVHADCAGRPGVEGEFQ